MDLRLGKLPAKRDKRTIPLKAVLRPALLPALPESFDCQEQWAVKDNFMYANDEFGDCVIAARAHQTLVFEAYEQSKQITITDDEVVQEYLNESGGADVGLYLLESLKSWRNYGWPIGDLVYDIYAFASVDWKNPKEVRQCIHLLGGVNFGMTVYQKDIEQFENREPWTLTDNDGWIRGGHGVYLFQYDDDGLTCMTWGKKQRMTWEFWNARVDEAYAIVDNCNDWMAETSPVDIDKLEGYLTEITGGTEPEQPGCLCPWLGRLIRKVKR